MSIENQNTDTTTENVENESNEQKTSMVPSYRLREVTEKRKEVEKELEAYKAADRERQDADKSFEQKYNDLSTEFTSYKENVSKQTLKNELTGQLVELGFPRKIANLVDTSSLTEDNMKDQVKSFAKEMAEFLPADKTKEDNTKKDTPLSNIQPSSTEVKQQFNGTITGKEVMNDLINKNK